MQGHDRSIKRVRTRAVGYLAAGFVISALIASSLVALLGRLVERNLADSTRLAVALLLIGAMTIAASLRRSVFVPFVSRQTPQQASSRRGGTFWWGLDTGLMITTIRVTYLTPIVLLVSALGYGRFWMGLLYAVGFIGPTAWHVLSRRGEEDEYELVCTLEGRKTSLRTFGLAAGIGLGVTMLVTLVMFHSGQAATLLAAAARVAITATFLSAVIGKLRAPSSLPATLRALGVPGPAVAASVVVGGEMLVVALLVFPAAATGALILAAGLAVAFAGSGIVAVRRRLHIACACFGSGAHNLGWRQVMILPVLLGMSAIAALRGLTPTQSLLACTAGCAAAAVVAAARTVSHWEELRLDRINMDRDDEFLAAHQARIVQWLPQH